jgi:D-alanyl-D-alanine carboxypeptidase/D-alanyl-D-alanine-endopeptidase (penicillin-binding protein 4)
LLAVTALAAGCAARQAPSAAPPLSTAVASVSSGVTQRRALDAIFNDPLFARATFGVRIESLGDGRVIYTRNSDKLVVPASNMKLLTMAVAAERLGWDFTFETRLDAAGTVAEGTLTGDLLVVGGGDPSIDAQGGGAAPLFVEWADALWAAGIRRVDGRVIGDDNILDDTIIGPGWAWDYLGDGYAAGSGALNYNENAAVIRVRPGQTVGALAHVELTPAGHGLVMTSEVTTGPAGVLPSMSQFRRPGSNALTLSGTIPVDRAVVVRTAAVENPTQFFVNGLTGALEARGIVVRGGAWDIDNLETPAVSGNRRTIATHRSQPLSAQCPAPGEDQASNVAQIVAGISEQRE